MIARSRETPHSLVVRTQIVLKAAAGDNNKTISQDLGLKVGYLLKVVNENTVWGRFFNNLKKK